MPYIINKYHYTISVIDTLIMPPIIIYIGAFAAAILTLMTGFGVGTVLTPIFTFFFEVQIAILMVAVIHFSNNLFKLYLFRKHIDKAIIMKFGVLSIIGAFVGAFLQVYMQSHALKVFLGIALIILAGREFIPTKKEFQLPKSIDAIGGFASGLLGGLVGNQGAVRSAYLLNYNISKDAFIASGTLIACFVDATRIPLYLYNYGDKLSSEWLFIGSVVATAYIGTLIGKRVVAYLPLKAFKKIVAGVIILMGIVLIVS